MFNLLLPLNNPWSIIFQFPFTRDNSDCLVCIYSLAFLHPIIAFTPMFSFSSKSQLSDATVRVTRTGNFPRVGPTYNLNANLCRKQRDILDLIFAEFFILFHCDIPTSNVAKTIFWFLRRILIKILVPCSFFLGATYKPQKCLYKCNCHCARWYESITEVEI